METVINQQSNERMFRINRIFSMIEKSNSINKAVSRRKLIAVCCLDWGMSRRKIVEYLSTLRDAERIVVEDDNVFTKKFFDKYIIPKRSTSPENQKLLKEV